MFILLLLAGALAVAAGVASTRKQVPAATSAAIADMMNRYTTVGPNGERVFNSDVAEAILRTLSGQLYHYLGTGGDPSQVQVSADPAGVPPSPDLSALSWARAQDKAMTIMAPVYMAEASTATRYLRAIAPGKENWDGGALYAVLAYPGALALGKAPGVPAAPGTLPPPVIVPTPLGQAAAAMPADIATLYQQLLQSGVDPAEMLTVANELDALGFSSAAELLRKRAADLHAIPNVTPPTPLPAPGQGGRAMPPPGVIVGPNEILLQPVHVSDLVLVRGKPVTNLDFFHFR